MLFLQEYVIFVEIFTLLDLNNVMKILLDVIQIVRQPLIVWLNQMGVRVVVVMESLILIWKAVMMEIYKIQMVVQIYAKSKLVLHVFS